MLYIHSGAGILNDAITKSYEERSGGSRGIAQSKSIRGEVKAPYPAKNSEVRRFGISGEEKAIFRGRHEDRRFLPAPEEADYGANRCRRAGLVQKRWPPLPDSHQRCIEEDNGTRDEGDSL